MDVMDTIENKSRKKKLLFLLQYLQMLLWLLLLLLLVAFKLIYYCLPVLLKCHSQHLNNKPEQKHVIVIVAFVIVFLVFVWCCCCFFSRVFITLPHWLWHKVEVKKNLPKTITNNDQHNKQTTAAAAIQCSSNSRIIAIFDVIYRLCLCHAWTMLHVKQFV